MGGNIEVQFLIVELGSDCKAADCVNTLGIALRGKEMLRRDLGLIGVA